MNTKGNEKFQLTHQKIMDVLIDLLQQKDLKKITVGELCKGAEINRSTFYEHFLDIYDLMDAVEHQKAIAAGERFKNGFRTSRKLGFLEIFRYIKENKVFYKVYLSYSQMFYLIDEMLSQKKEAAKAQRFKSELEYDYHMTFFRAGINAMIRYWLDRDCTESPEELFEILKSEYSQSLDFYTDTGSLIHENR